MNPERSNARRVEIAQKHITVLRNHLERGDLDDGLVFDAVKKDLTRFESGLTELADAVG